MCIVLPWGSVKFLFKSKNKSSQGNKGNPRILNYNIGVMEDVYLSTS